ncbi:concanavalin A-like lectin/glucanase superfamily protein [Sinobacterium caligoides]|uniref:Concanavalin A-like lectin/glucanase superfamily protein n=1 Tax=Sinobacterium caligoides TaxID=933926 RepID=A0A3N2E0P7_9GAMM|nr:LamG-like jellyroll fold domain-containing protein [Sinobacterium caligoides]ROS05145.1 concanavalin A-like lectin/glucanase superfamily protein [Sinobacterium caligoides]
MNSNKQPKKYTLNGEDVALDTSTVDDSRFGRCVTLTQGDSLSFGKPTDIGFSVTEFTSTIWLKLSSKGSIFDYLGPSGFGCNSQGRLTLLWQTIGDSHTLSYGVWYHLSLVKSSDQVSLYVNGKLATSLKVPSQWNSAVIYNKGDIVLLNDKIYSCQWWSKGDSPDNPAGIESYVWEENNDSAINQWESDRDDYFDKCDYSCLDGELHLSSQNFYPFALQANEIYDDFFSALPPVVESCSDIYPFDINIFASGAVEAENCLFIDPDENTNSVLNITNINHDDIVVLARSGAVSAYNYHFSIRFRNKTFRKDAEVIVSALDAGAASWDISSAIQDPIDGSWSVYFLCLSDMTIASNATLSFVLGYKSACGTLGARSTHIALYYQNAQFVAGGNVHGDRFKQVDILNLADNNAYVRQVSEKVAKTNSFVDGVEFELKNQVDKLKSYMLADSKEEKIGYVADAASNSGKLTDFVEAINLLVQHGINLDNEVDLRATMYESKFDALERLYPLAVSLGAPQSVVCDDFSDISIFIFNRSDFKLELAVENLHSVIEIAIPLGDDVESLVASGAGDSAGSFEYVNAGKGSSVTGELTKDTSSPKRVAFAFKAGVGSYIAANSFIEIKIKDLFANRHIGSSFITVNLSNIPNYCDNSFSCVVTKTERDLSCLLGGGNVAIGKDKPCNNVKLDVAGDIASDNLKVNNAIVTSRVSTNDLISCNVDTDFLDAIDISSSNNIDTKTLCASGRISDENGMLLAVPIGGIIMWSPRPISNHEEGDSNLIPPGFNVCDGSNNTPDLREKFIVAAGASADKVSPNRFSTPLLDENREEYEYQLGSMSGENRVSLTPEQMPEHKHTGVVHDTNINKGDGWAWKLMHPTTYATHVDNGNHNTIYDRNAQNFIATLNECIHLTHSHEFSINNSGGGQSHENRPAYYSLLFIQRVE